MDLTVLTREELIQVRKDVDAEFVRRQVEKRKTCKHGVYVDIMYMRPGAFYKGCKYCQISKHQVDPDSSEALLRFTESQEAKIQAISHPNY